MYEKRVVITVWVNNFLKMINLLTIFASGDGKQLLSRLDAAIFSSFMQKMWRMWINNDDPHYHILSDVLAIKLA